MAQPHIVCLITLLVDQFLPSNERWIAGSQSASHRAHRPLWEARIRSMHMCASGQPYHLWALLVITDGVRLGDRVSKFQLAPAAARSVWTRSLPGTHNLFTPPSSYSFWLMRFVTSFPFDDALAGMTEPVRLPLGSVDACIAISHFAR